MILVGTLIAKMHDLNMVQNVIKNKKLINVFFRNSSDLS